jgi:hypothetical protein
MKTNVKFFYRFGQLLVDEGIVNLGDVPDAPVPEQDIDPFIKRVIQAVLRFPRKYQVSGIGRINIPFPANHGMDLTEFLFRDRVRLQFQFEEFPVQDGTAKK